MLNDTHNIIGGIAVFVWLISRQLRTRSVQESSSMKGSVILAIIGVYELVEATYAKGHTIGRATVIWIIASLIAAAVLGVIRSLSVKIWRDAMGNILSKGSVMSLILWVISLAIHFAFELGINHSTTIHGLGSLTILLYLAVSLGVQREVVRLRAFAI